MCLGVGNLGEVAAGGSRRSQTSAETTMGFGGVFRCMCVGVHKEMLTSKWSGTVPPETQMSSCHLLGNLGSRVSYRPICVSEPAAAGIYTVHTCV